MSRPTTNPQQPPQPHQPKKKTQVLTTGKYLHVIRECGQAIPSPSSPTTPSTSTALAPPSSDAGGDANANAAAAAFPRLRYAAGKAAVGEAIETAYRRACRLLLDLLLGKHRLLPRLVGQCVWGWWVLGVSGLVCVWCGGDGAHPSVTTHHTGTQASIKHNSTTKKKKHTPPSTLPHLNRRRSSTTFCWTRATFSCTS